MSNDPARHRSSPSTDDSADESHQELEPLEPDRAVDLYLESRADDASDWTLTSHESRLRPFLEWCDEEGNVRNMNELTGRDLYEYRVWRREGHYSGAEVDRLAVTTLKTALSTLRRFLRFCANVEAVHPDLYMKVPIPTVSDNEEVSDSKIVPERVSPILEYLERYHWASRDHLMMLLMWHTGGRISDLRAIDLDDLDLEGHKPGMSIKNRPETDTRLKNADGGERYNRLSEEVANIIQDYIDGPRVDKLDDYGREPLLTTTEGRTSAGTVRQTSYKVTRPCWIGEDCPHGKDPKTCEWNSYDQASKCPSTRSPHDWRKARVTKYRNDGIQRGVVSDRLDASERVLDKHYDRASEREKADRRWREIQR